MSKLQNDIYQRFRGFKTVRRGDKKQGQSEWYYVDPRYDKDDDARRQIDVESENSPNPRLSDILANDMDENPQDYYIWRTKKDDKVRGAHAEREGKIFNRHVPPDGGNPGEDYNCRCWAEPYKPERYKDKPMIVDVSGILPEKVGTDKKLPEGSYTTEQGNMTTDVPVQFLKLPETEESDNQEHSLPLVPIPARKPKIAEPQTTANKIVPVPARKPLPENATLEQMLQQYILEHSPNLQQNLPQLNNTNSYTTESSWGYPNSTQLPYYQQMGKPYTLQRYPKYRFGMLNEKEEANNNPASIGYDKDGGHSYGLYQIASKTTSMKGYLNFLATSNDPDLIRYYNTLFQAGGSAGARLRSENFEKAWKELASEQKFSESQKNFILSENYIPVLRRISDIKGLNLEQRHPVIQDVLYSMSTQHYRADIPIHKALGKNSDISKWSDEDIINALFDARTEYVRDLNMADKKAQYNIIHYRYPRERKRALELLKEKFSGLI